jgi:integrase
MALIDRLASKGVTLATANQGHLEAWLASNDASRRGHVGHFVRWARAQKLTSLEFPAQRWGGPTGVIDAEKRWEQARRLLHDHTLDPADRVAGLLVLLYAQRAAAISRLTLIHVQENDGGVRLHLGARPVVLPDPLAGLVLELVAKRRGHAALGDQGASPFLFPGGQPGRPMSASRLAERLTHLGIQSGPARSAALFQLSTEVPAAVLARMLGVHITVAVQWQRASSGDWMAYAAERSRLGTGQRS